MKIKGAIFDLDGTLIDSIEDIADSMNIVLAEKGFPEHDILSYKVFVGNGIKTLVRRALPKDSSEEAVERCFAAMMTRYERFCDVKSAPYKGIPELLTVLHERGVKMAVLSNKADRITKRVIATLLPGTPFVNVEGLTDEATKKPNPANALKICDNMGVRPEEIIYLGDTGTDMETAKRAGFYAVGVLWGFRGKDELISHGADILISTPDELLKLL
jgi:phosphoglycolate phosphatase